MSGTTDTLRALHDGERRLERALLAAAERHRAEHEVHHVATDLARWSREHARRIADAARDHGLDLPGPPGAPGPSDVSDVPGPPDVPGPHSESGLRLLHDLRDLHLAATANSLHWEMLAQVAQATGDDTLLSLATACHPQTLRQMRWSNTMLKTLSPQLLSSL
nr:hypothetical protein KitaXyl93_08260 [Kitasatospora sp. Xyl93]